MSLQLVHRGHGFSTCRYAIQRKGGAVSKRNGSGSGDAGILRNLSVIIRVRSTYLIVITGLLQAKPSLNCVNPRDLEPFQERCLSRISGNVSQPCQSMQGRHGTHVVSSSLELWTYLI